MKWTFESDDGYIVNENGAAIAKMISPVATVINTVVLAPEMAEALQVLADLYHHAVGFDAVNHRGYYVARAILARLEDDKGVTP